MSVRRPAVMLAFLAVFACGDDRSQEFLTSTEADGLELRCSVQPASGPAPLAVKLKVEGTDGAPIVHWTMGDGGGANGTELEYTYRHQGTFTPAVTAKKSGRQGTCRTPPVQVAAVGLPASTPIPNRTPRLNVRFDPSQAGSAPFTVVVNLCASDDPDGDPLTYTVQFGDGAEDSGGRCRKLPHTYERRGRYTLRACVTDRRFEVCQSFTINAT